ncbi:MAG: hypothetical protein GX762_06485 [Bacteroidales bacterium]|nr:hypothetical protein [Bacteroidales bacterium]
MIKYIAVLLITSMTSVVACAQDSLSEIEIEVEPTAIDGGPFYAQLWFWVVIGVVFLLLLIVLLRGSGGKKKPEKEVEEKVEQTLINNQDINEVKG